jgi:hypothetical protein
MLGLELRYAGIKDKICWDWDQDQMGLGLG